MKRLVIGILAHVDSGKTTLSEGLLYTSGMLRTLGRVDHQNAFLDTDIQERARGITIFSKQAIIRTDNTEFTLLDTPGHVDFSPEMERALQVMDYAILVISGTDGVQSHTETLWRLLRRNRIPTFLFINKMDLAVSEPSEVLQRVRARLGDGCMDLSNGIDNDDVQDQIAMCGEWLMEQYLSNGQISEDQFRKAILNCEVFPCWFGSALKLTGVAEFLTGIERYTDSLPTDRPFGARVYKIARDNMGTRLTYLKLTGGSLPVRSQIKVIDKNGVEHTEKINGLRVYSGTKFSTADTAYAGTVYAVTGLEHTYPGMGLGAEAGSQTPSLQPVLTYRVELPEGFDAVRGLCMFRSLEEEEPQLHVTWNEVLQEIRVQIMGQVQLEILQELILQRHGVEVSFSQGGILYQETIANTVEGVGHFEPLRHYAEVHLLMEPGERGSGLVFSSSLSEDILDRSWQRLILTHLEEKPHQGVLIGAPITDMKITLTAGKAHLKHSEGGDFRQATYRAVRQGLMQAESVLLEPWYSYRLDVPLDCVGHAMSDLQRMNGTFVQGETWDDMTTLTGTAPVSQMQDYQRNVASYSRGRGHFSCWFDGYAPCHEQAAVVEAAAYDPEADLENTPDSVFCSHGAGTVVKWYDVPTQMHLESTLKPIEQEVEQERTWQQRAADYCAHAATDKELMAIFERTYGPIRRSIPSVMPAAKEPSSVKQRKAPSPPVGPEYVLVDGYNIIFAWDDLKTLAEIDLEAARQQLTERMIAYQGVRQCELILVFDAYKVKGNHGSVEKVGDISVVYTKEAETADMYIERVTHEIGKNKKVRVATSDGLIQMIILGHGALRVSAAMFRLEVEAAEKAIQDYIASQK